MPELIKRKCKNPDAYLDEQDLKDIAEVKKISVRVVFTLPKKYVPDLGLNELFFFLDRSFP